MINCMMNFERGIDPKKAIDIGYIHLLKKMDGIILTEDETWQYNKWLYDPNIWTEKPNIKTAADFDWLDDWLLNKTAENSIVIGVLNGEFEIYKNVYFWCTRGYKGDRKDLYKVISYWYQKKRKFRRRKKWRDVENVGHIFV